MREVTQSCKRDVNDKLEVIAELFSVEATKDNSL
jgi:hypothetical protein